MPQRRVLLGHIAGAHGIKGDVLVNTYTGEPQNIAAYGPLSDETGQRTFTLRVRRVTAKGVIASIDGIEDRTAAEALKGTRLHVERDKLPRTTDDEYYHADLIGLSAVASDGTPVGTVSAVHNFGAGDLIEIARPGSRRTELLPFTEAFVLEVDLNGGRLIVKLPE
jgi:16S rRNA processing protein RimM